MADNKTSCRRSLDGGDDGDCGGDEKSHTINRSFNAETRHKIASITRKSTAPGLVEEKDIPHPLLKLEQHLDERQGVGASMKPPRQEDEKIHATVNKNINGTTEDDTKSTVAKSVDSSAKNRESDGMNASKSKTSRDPLSPTAGHETRPTIASPARMPRSLLRTLLKLLIVFFLLAFWTVLLNSIVSEMSLNDSFDALATKATVELVDIRVKALKTKNLVLTLFSNDDVGVRNLDQVAERVELGRSLLSVYDDAFGSSQYCESAFQGIFDVDDRSEGPLYLVRISPQLIEKYNLEETKLVARVLLCIGEARLALFATSVEPTCAKKGTLRYGKECFEAASTMDPTNPSIRAGLGLSYLLLTVAPCACDQVCAQQLDVKKNYIYNSIQHLKAAIGLSKGASATEEGNAIRTAAIHNLGLAYIVLDSYTEGMSTYFSDWAASLQQSAKYSHPIIESWAFAVNEGASLLHSGKVDEAILQLELISSSQPCISTQSPACLIARQNLELAKELKFGPDQQSGAIDSGRIALYQKISRWQDTTGANQTDSEILSEHEELSNETMIEDEELEIEAEDNRTEIQTEPMDEPETPLNSALAALEKAALEGEPQTRLLLALARARSSTGDKARAVDAALLAVKASMTGEEADSATSYLETLMQSINDEDKDETFGVIPVEDPPKKSEATAPLRGDRDFAVTELELRLELERLKNKVLEQEIRFGRNYHETGSLPEYHHDRRPAIESVGTDPRDQRRVRVNVDPEPEPDVENKEKVASPDPVLPEQTLSEVDDSPEIVSHKPPEDVPAQDTNEATELDSGDLVATQEVASDEAAPAGPGAESDQEVNSTEVVDEPEPDDTDSSEEEEILPVVLPSLFEPPHSTPQAMPATAKSYMKMADAYLDKGKYVLASKQFLKVIKKAPDHLPAHLGYATSLERAGKRKQINAAALAYCNSTKVAVSQGDRIDPMANSGAGGIAENILRRSMQLAKTAPSERLQTLQAISAYAPTYALAADIYFEIGKEAAKTNITEAKTAFRIANGLIEKRNDSQTPFHAASLVEVARISLEADNVPSRAVEIFETLKDAHMEDSIHVDLLVLTGRAHVLLGDLHAAITELTRALSLPECTSTSLAHHELAIALTKSNGDSSEIKTHFEKALDMGMDPTPEATEALGDRNMALARSLNRQYYKSYNQGSDVSGGGGGGILNSGVASAQSSSVFAPQTPQEDTGGTDNTLSMLEQGAASYDPNNVMGGSTEGSASHLSELNARKQTKESSLNELKRP